MKKLLLCLLVSSSLLPGFAQDRAVLDSLGQLLQQNISEQEQIQAHHAWVQEFLNAGHPATFTSQDSSMVMHHVSAARALAQQLNQPDALAMGHCYQGRVYYLAGHNAKAIAHLQKAFDFCPNQADCPQAISSIYLQLGKYHFFNQDNEAALAHLNSAVTHATRYENYDDLAQANLYLALLHASFSYGNTEATEKYIAQATHTLSLTGDHRSLGQMHQRLALIAKGKGQSIQALGHFQDALNHAGLAADTITIIWARTFMGDLYEEWGMVPEALEHMNYAYELAKGNSHKMKTWKAMVLNHAAIVYRNHIDVDTAITMLQEYQQMVKGDPNAESYAYLNLGMAHLQKQEHGSTVASLEKALSMPGIDRDFFIQCASHTYLGQAYLGQGQLQEALPHLQLGLSLAQKHQMILRAKVAAKALSEVYAQLGQHQKAYQANLLYKQMTDSLARQETARALTRQQWQRQQQVKEDSLLAAQQEHQLKQQRMLNRRRRVQLQVIAGLAASLLVLGLLFTLLFLRKRR